ncbi:MAG: DUF4412 domain-containing protein [Dehalococcoidia bacterium]
MMMKKILALTLVLMLMASGLTLAACGNGDDDGNGEVTPEETAEQELTGTATYSGEWSGSSETMGDVGGTWEFTVDFDAGTVSGWFKGDSAGDISGSVVGGEIEASGSAALGSVSWDGSFNADGSRISGEWKFAGGLGNGTWEGTRGEVEETAQTEPDETPTGEPEETGDTGDTGDEGTEAVNLPGLVSKAEEIDCFHGKGTVSNPGMADQDLEFWMKGDRMRIEGSFSAQGQVQEGIIIQDYAAGEMVFYSSEMGQAMKMSIDDPQTGEEAPDEPTGEVESIMQWDPKVTGSEEINGKHCAIVEYTDSSGTTTTMWIWVDYGFPVKSIVETAEGDVITEFKEIDFDCPPESKFELPAGVEVMDLGDMGGFDSGSMDMP